MRKAPRIVQLIAAPWNDEVLVGLDDQGNIWRITTTVVKDMIVRGGSKMRRVHYQQYEVGQVNG